MGGGLPVEPMSKGIMLSEMDQRINGWMRWSEWKKLEDLIRALKPISNAQDYLDTLVNHECMQRPVSAYLMTYWYDPHSQWCYWPGKDFIKITIEGKIKAFELALMHRLPLDSYWASLGRTDNDFRVIVLQVNSRLPLSLLRRLLRCHWYSLEQCLVVDAQAKCPFGSYIAGKRNKT
jgi:hypothetical protein